MVSRGWALQTLVTPPLSLSFILSCLYISQHLYSIKSFFCTRSWSPDDDCTNFGDSSPFPLIYPLLPPYISTFILNNIVFCTCSWSPDEGRYRLRWLLPFPPHVSSPASIRSQFCSYSVKYLYSDLLHNIVFCTRSWSPDDEHYQLWWLLPFPLLYPLMPLYISTSILNNIVFCTRLWSPEDVSHTDWRDSLTFPLGWDRLPWKLVTCPHRMN